MGDRQCGLCLSCGVPMMPKPENIDTYAVDRGYLSLMHLNNEFRIAASMTKFHNPHFTSIENLAHVCHTSHHQTAVKYMMDTHTGDQSVRPVHDRRRALAAFAYYKTPSTKKTPQIAWWPRPPKDERIKYRSLRSFITRTVSGVPDPEKARFVDALDLEDIDVKFKTCRDCNGVMTREARFNELLQNERLFTNLGAMTVVNASGGVGVAPANWTRDGAPRRQDGLAPRLAYYLHLCMPFVSDPAHDWFEGVAGAGEETHKVMRKFYVQQAWLVLQVACLCGTVERSEVEGGAALTAGTKAYTGSLDFYVSYFCWRMFLFEHGTTFHQRSLDFVQWHQKYMWHAHGCPGLDLPRRQTIGANVEPSGSPTARGLVEGVQRRLVRLYRRTLRPLTDFLRGVASPPREITEYFVKPSRLGGLIRASARYKFCIALVSWSKMKAREPAAGAATSTWTTPCATSGSPPSSPTSSSCAPTTRTTCGSSSATSGTTGGCGRSATSPSTTRASTRARPGSGTTLPTSSKRPAPCPRTRRRSRPSCAGPSARPGSPSRPSGTCGPSASGGSRTSDACRDTSRHVQAGQELREEVLDVGRLLGPRQPLLQLRHLGRQRGRARREGDDLAGEAGIKEHPASCPALIVNP
jgi:hypothetical protein